MDNAFNPDFGSGSRRNLSDTSNFALDPEIPEDVLLLSDSNANLPTGFHAAMLHASPSEVPHYPPVLPTSPVRNEHLRQVVHRVWNSPVAQQVLPTSPAQNEHLRQVVHRIWNSPVAQHRLSPNLERQPAGCLDSLAVWTKNPDMDAATSPKSPCGDRSQDTGNADAAEWQGWQKLAQQTTGNNGMDVANLAELRAFMTNQFEGLRADLQQQHAVAESLRQQLSREMRQSAVLQQQLQHLAAMHQSQLTEVNAAHASITNAKIHGLVSQVRQLSIEKNACQAQLTSQQAANAQQVRQMEHLEQLLQYTQSQLSAAGAQPSAAAGSPVEQVEQLKQQLQEAEQEIIKAERRCSAYQAQLAVEISKLKRATVAHTKECEVVKSENAAVRARLETAMTELKNLRKQVAESKVTWGSTCD